MKEKKEKFSVDLFISDEACTRFLFRRYFCRWKCRGCGRTGTYKFYGYSKRSYQCTSCQHHLSPASFSVMYKARDLPHYFQFLFLLSESGEGISVKKFGSIIKSSGSAQYIKKNIEKALSSAGIVCVTDWPMKKLKPEWKQREPTMLLSYKNMSVKLSWSGRDKCYYGQIKDTPDLISIQGRTAEEFIKTFKEQADQYINKSLPLS